MKMDKKWKNDENSVFFEKNVQNRKLVNLFHWCNF